MSGIAGVYNGDGKPVERLLLQRMSNTLAHRGPDASGCWIDGPVGMVHRMLWTTSESLHETQPLRDETGTLCLTLDGRVDNRKELRAALEDQDATFRTDTDAELVLRAYQRWGKGCPQKLIGDFAFVIWDGRNRQLFCARDPLGIKPLYYTFDGRIFLWGSEPQSLFAGLPLRLEPNQGMMGEYLSDNICDVEETLYQGVFRLAPAHHLTVQNESLRKERYFDIDPSKEIRYRSDEDYAEHFYDILKEAVRCRLRSQSPVSLFLSGGVDSSAIAGVAQFLTGQGLVAPCGLETYSLTFSHPAADEHTYVEDVIKQLGLTAHSVNAHGWAPPALRDQVCRLRDFPDLPNTSPWGLLYSLARDRGSRVALWGFGGDEWLTGDSAHCADLLRQYRIPTLLRQIRHDLRTSNLWGGRDVTLTDAVQWCLLPLIPPSLKALIKRSMNWNIPRWITPTFARKVALQDRFLGDTALPQFPTLAQREIYRQFRNGWSTTEYELLNRFESNMSLEGRFPFCDRRLIEFAVALPEEQRWRADQTKFVLRQAVGKLLPDSVRQRMTKADFSFLYSETFARERAGELFQSFRLASDGYVDAAKTQEIYRQCSQGNGRYFGPIWMILATEHWYSTLFPVAA